MPSTIQQLKKVFGLSASAPDTELISRATACAKIAADHLEHEDEERIISNIVAESGGAVSRKTARQVIQNRGGFSVVKKKI